MVRDISKEQAQSVLTILVQECGHCVIGIRDGDSFVRSIMWPQPKDEYADKHPCTEYRFCGALGFGGKFRNNGNRNDTPYVDCYREHETPERLAMIEVANKRLAELFQDNH